MNEKIAPPLALSLTKADLAEELFERIGLNKREAKDLVDTFFETVREALARGDTVKLSGFGSFQVRSKPPRPGRNPKTGEIIPIAARRVVTFHASQKLKSVVANAALPATSAQAPQPDTASPDRQISHPTAGGQA